VIFQKENHTKRKNLDGAHGKDQKNLFLQERNIFVGKIKTWTLRSYD
jgi:hypothetical protein